MFRISCFWILVHLLSFSFLLGQGTDIDLLTEREYVLEMKEGWQQINGEQTLDISIPFAIDSVDAIELSFTFCLSENEIQDSLFLYFEGLAWTAELLLDQAYIGVNEKPFEPWLVPLSSQMFIADQSYRLYIRLQKGTPFEWAPKQFLGMLQAPYLLTR